MTIDEVEPLPAAADSAEPEPAAEPDDAGGEQPVPAGPQAGEHGLYSIGAAAALLGISERALRYYQQLGLLHPCGRTPGGMRRYSDEDIARVSRIRELKSVLGLELDEIADVMEKDDRIAKLRQRYRDERTSAAERRQLLIEGLELQQTLRSTVEAKREALDQFLAGIDERIARIEGLLAAD